MANSYTFDGPNKKIRLASTGSFTVKDAFSRWKEWVHTSDNAKYLQAFRSVGGDPTIAGRFLGATYFLLNNWRFVPTASDHRLQIDGNIYTSEADSPVDTVIGSSILVETTVSNLTDTTILQSSLEQTLEYGGTVYVNPASGFAGTSYPVGTVASASNSLTNGINIARSLGFYKLILLSSGSSDGADLSDLNIEGLNQNTVLYITGSNTDNCNFFNLIVSGSFTGRTHIDSCDVGNITNFSGRIGTSGIAGPIELSPTSNTTIHNSYSDIPGLNSPIIDCISSSGAILAMRDYSGGASIKNLTDPTFVATIEFIAGRFNIDNTSTDGFISVRGIASINNSGSTTTLETGSLINQIVRTSVQVTEDRVEEVWRIHGLDPTASVHVTKTGRTVTGISQSIANSGTGSSAETIITRI